VQHDVAEAEAAFGQRYVVDACTHRINAAHIHHFGIGPRCQAHTGHAEVALDRTFALGQGDATAGPLAARFGPVTGAGGGDTGIPRGGFIELAAQLF